jgi:DNA replication and repair protein RecF
VTRLGLTEGAFRLRLNELVLQNFRNYESLSFFPAAGINILHGKNGSGKTSLLEAIYYLAVGSSQRGGRETELVTWGKDFFRVKGVVALASEQHEIEYRFHAGTKKVLVDGIAQTRLGDATPVLTSVFFSPDDLRLIKGAPAVRRRFLDIALSQVSARYRKLLSQYHRALLQRNNLLRFEGPRAAGALLQIWEEQLAEFGSRLILFRMRALQELKPLAAQAHREMAGGSEDLELQYAASVGEIEGEIQQLEQVYLNSLIECRSTDIQRGHTTIGPHRDELGILINGHEARIYGSQGQQRTAALSLRIAEFWFLHAQLGRKPVLLLDDVLSELDEQRRLALLARLAASSSGQTFVTGTDPQRMLGIPTAQAAVFRVTSGSLQREG